MLRSFTTCMRRRSTIATSAGLATTVETVELTLVRAHRKKLPPAADAFLRLLPSDSTFRKPAPIRSYALRSIVASRPSLPPLRPQHSAVAESFPPAKAAPFTAVLAMPDEATHDQPTSHPATTLVAPSTRVTFLRSSGLLLQIRLTLNRTANIRSSRKSCTRKKRRTGRNLNASRKKNTSDSQNKMPPNLEGSRSSSAISNRRSKCSSAMRRNNKKWSRESRRCALPQNRNIESQTSGCPISRVFCEKWGFSFATTNSPTSQQLQTGPTQPRPNILARPCSPMARWPEFPTSSVSAALRPRPSRP